MRITRQGSEDIEERNDRCCADCEETQFFFVAAGTMGSTGVGSAGHYPAVNFQLSAHVRLDYVLSGVSYR